MIKGSKEYIEFRRKANERNRKYYSKPEVKERKRIYKKQYDKNNKERISKYGYELRARPEYKKRIKRWREENKEHLKIKDKEWRNKNKEHKREKDRIYHKKYYQLHKNKRKIYMKKYKSENPIRYKLQKQRYNLSEKGKICSTKYVHKRLSRIRNSKFNLSSKDIELIFSKFDCCVYCGSKERLTLDHVIPISKGGETSIKNLVVACQRCNTSKGDKNVLDWLDNLY